MHCPNVIKCIDLKLQKITTKLSDFNLFSFIGKQVYKTKIIQFMNPINLKRQLMASAIKDNFRHI